MNWANIDDELPPDDTPVLLEYIRLRPNKSDPEKITYDVGKFKKGKLFMIGNYFAWDICEKVLRFTLIIP